jgi:hypothetical protein
MPLLFLLQEEGTLQRVILYVFCSQLGVKGWLKGCLRYK